MSIKSVVLLGADGSLGPAVLHALVENGFNVTILKRQSSKSPSSYPNEVRVPDDFPIDVLTSVLRGKDAVITTIKAGNQVEFQTRLADAAVRAGVKRFIPADFGSVDSSSPLVQSLIPLYKDKTLVREHLISLAAQNPDFTWTSLVCGHFFDWSPEFLHIWIRERKAQIVDDGEHLWSASTLSRIGEATARILRNPEKTGNRILYVQSFLVTQKQVVGAFEKATGAKWEVERLESEAYKNERKGEADKGNLEAVEDLVWLLGAIDANWEERDGFAMELLGFGNEDLDRVVARVVEEATSK